MLQSMGSQRVGHDWETKQQNKVISRESQFHLNQRIRPVAVIVYLLICVQLFRDPVDCTGVGCYFLLQRIFPTQGSNPGLLFGRWILYHWEATWEAHIHIMAVFKQEECRKKHKAVIEHASSNLLRSSGVFTLNPQCMWWHTQSSVHFFPVMHFDSLLLYWSGSEENCRNQWTFWKFLHRPELY